MSRSLRRGFPTTRYSVVRASAAKDPEVRRQAFELLARAYWTPVYKYLRIRWRKSREDAEDLAQEFFDRAMEKGYFGRYDASKARFRTFIRVCLDRFVGHAAKTATRLKRGGGAPVLSLDVDRAESELLRRFPLGEMDPKQYFHREWLRSFFRLTVDELKENLTAAGKLAHYRLFERIELAGDGAVKPSYAELAQELGVTTSQVNNHLAAARRRFREIVLTRLREYCGSDEEFRREARELLGVEPQ